MIYGNKMNFREFKEKVKDYPLFGSDVLDILSKRSQALRNQISRWQKKKLIVVLKRGLYTLNPEERKVGLSACFLANNLYSPSYLSLESALSYYKLIPERISALTSVTTRKTKIFTNDLGTFTYKKLKTDLFFGFVEEKDEYGFKFMIAEPEKALLDYLYLNLGRIDKDFRASLRLQNLGRLDKNKVKKYARKFAIKRLSSLLEKL